MGDAVHWRLPKSIIRNFERPVGIQVEMSSKQLSLQLEDPDGD